MEKKILNIAIGLVHDNGDLLITKRKPDAHLGSLWEFPGGKIQHNESPKDAVYREMLEEVGLEVEVGELFHQETAHYSERSVCLYFFDCRKKNPDATAQTLEVTECRWVNPSQLDGFEFPQGNKTLLQRLKARSDLA